MLDVIGLATVAMDVIMQVDELPQEDGFAIVGKSNYLPGGSGTNVITQVSRLSGKCGFMAQIGDDNLGEEIKSSIVQEKIDEHGLRMIPNSTSLHTDIVVDSKGRKFILLNMGNSFLNMKESDVDVNYLTQAKILYTDFLPGEAALQALKEAKKAGMTTVFNLQVGMNTMENLGVSKEMVLEALQYVDIFAPCQGGFYQLCETQDLPEACKYIRGYFKKLLLVTLGSKGSIAFGDNDAETFVPVYPIKVVDTTGAGDSYLGAFMYSYLIDKKPLKAAMEFATACAAFTCQNVGARTCPTLNQANEMLNHGK